MTRFATLILFSFILVGCTEAGKQLDYVAGKADDAIGDLLAAKPSELQVESGEQFFELLLNGKFDDAYAMLSESSRETMTVEELTAQWSSSLEEFGGLSKIVHESQVEIDEDDSEFLFTRTVRFEGGVRVYFFHVLEDGSISDVAASDLDKKRRAIATGV